MATFYVSPTGNDSATGKTAGAAFKSLAKAQAAARLNGTTADTIVVRGGTYSLSSPLALTAKDSNTTWTAAAGETATITGGGRQMSLITASGATGVTIQGLSFQNTAAGSDNDLAPGAISVSGGSAIRIAGNTFSGTAKGVVADDGATK